MKLDVATTPVPPRPFAHEEWPYEPRFKRVNGWRMHYIDEGAGEPVVLLHGNPAWGFLYRKFVKPLTTAGRIPQADISMAYDARAPCRSLPSGPAQCVGWTWNVSVGGEQEAIPR